MHNTVLVAYIIGNLTETLKCVKYLNVKLIKRKEKKGSSEDKVAAATG